MVNKCSAGKENVPLALEVIHETTITTARSYFPNRRDVVNFLEIFNTWWTISIELFAKYTGNAVINGDKITVFLRTLAD